MSAELIGSRINGNTIELSVREHSNLNSRGSSLRAQSITGSRREVHVGGAAGKDVDGNMDNGKDIVIQQAAPLVYFSYSCASVGPDGADSPCYTSPVSVFSPELGYCRSAYYNIAVRVVLLIVLLMWAALPM